MFKKLKFIWKNRKAIKKVSKAVSNVQEEYKMKSGKLSTEFWLVIVSNLMTVAAALQGAISAEAMAIIMAVLNGLYASLRTYLKGQETKVKK